MRNQENTAYKVSRNYFLNGSSECMSSMGYLVSPSDRKTMLSWAYDIVDVCKIERHVAITAVSYLDRFLADNPVQSTKALSSRRSYQLCFIVCLIIALKNCAGMKVESEFVTNVLCHGLYQEKEIIEMEMIVLKGLRWRLNGPTGIDFVHAFLKLLPNQDDRKMKTLIKTAEIQVELAMGDFSLAVKEPSSIACSSIILAMNSHCGKSYSGVEVYPVDRFVWMQSVSMAAGIDFEGLTNSLVKNSLIENPSGYVTSSDSSEASSRGSSRMSSFCDDECYNSYASLGAHSDESIITCSYFSRNTK